VSTATRRSVVAAPIGCQAEVHKTSENNIFKPNPKNPERLARCRSAFEMQCFRNCTLSSFDYFDYFASRKCVVISAVSS